MKRNVRKQVLGMILLLTSINVFGQSSFFYSETAPERFNPRFDEYDQQTALFCGQLSGLVYEKEGVIARVIDTMNRIYPGAQYRFRFIRDKGFSTDTQLMLFGNPQFILVVFRGTQKLVLRDWITDAKFWKRGYERVSVEESANLPPGHNGFRHCIIRLITKKSILQQIDAFREECSPGAKRETFPVYLTGHSLGAALAQLFAEPLRYSGFNVRGAYHFAPPMAVKESSRDSMILKFGNITYDLVNYKDNVPRVGHNGTAHYGKFYRLCNDSLVRREAEQFCKIQVKDYFHEGQYHDLGNHLAIIRRSENREAEVRVRSARNESCITCN